MKKPGHFGIRKKLVVPLGLRWGGKGICSLPCCGRWAHSPCSAGFHQFPSYQGLFPLAGDAHPFSSASRKPSQEADVCGTVSFLLLSSRSSLKPPQRLGGSCSRLPPVGHSGSPLLLPPLTGGAFRRAEGGQGVRQVGGSPRRPVGTAPLHGHSLDLLLHRL